MDSQPTKSETAVSCHSLLEHTKFDAQLCILLIDMIDTIFYIWEFGFYCF